MDHGLLDDYASASAWTLEKVQGAAGQLDARTPCEQWDVRTLFNHMLETQHYFLGSAKGEDSAPPGPNPPELLGVDPAADFERVRGEMLAAFGEPGVIDRTGPSLGVAFADQLLHGWDLAAATGQNQVMPAGLAEAAYQAIHGLLTDEQRTGVFKPEVDVGPDASAQDRLLAYSGRDPSA